MFTRVKLIKNKYLTGLSSFGIQNMPGGKVSNSPCCAVAPFPCCAIVPFLICQKNESMLWILKPFQYVIKLMLLSFVLMLLLCQFQTGKQSLSIYWKHCSSTGEKKKPGKKSRHQSGTWRETQAPLFWQSVLPHVHRALSLPLWNIHICQPPKNVAVESKGALNWGFLATLHRQSQFCWVGTQQLYQAQAMLGQHFSP